MRFSSEGRRVGPHAGDLRHHQNGRRPSRAGYHLGAPTNSGAFGGGCHDGSTDHHITGHHHCTAPPTGLSVPSTIPADCSRPVDKELTSWIASVPDGSTLGFAANGCYGIDNTMLIQDRRNLTLQGNGSTFKTLTTGDAQRRVWRVRGATA